MKDRWYNSSQLTVVTFKEVCLKLRLKQIILTGHLNAELQWFPVYIAQWYPEGMMDLYLPMPDKSTPKVYSPIHSSQNAPLYMEASPKFALYLYQILDGFMGSYRPIKQWKVHIMWQHREDMPIWGVKVRKSDSHCSMLSVLLGDNKRIKVFDNLSKCSGMCQKCVKVL